MLSDGEIFLLSIYHSYSLILVNGKERGRFFGRGVGIGVGHVFGCGGAAGNLLGLDMWLDFPPFLSKSHMRCSSLWSQRLAVTVASTADAPPQVACGRDGMGRAGRNTKAMYVRSGRFTKTCPRAGRSRSGGQLLRFEGGQPGARDD